MDTIVICKYCRNATRMTTLLFDIDLQNKTQSREF